MRKTSTGTFGGGTSYGRDSFPDVATMLHGVIAVHPTKAGSGRDGRGIESDVVIVKAGDMSSPYGHGTSQHPHSKDPVVDSPDQYKRAALVDWEMAVLYLEDVYKTTGFGVCSSIWDRYAVYMNCISIRPPRDSSVDRLMEAMQHIWSALPRRNSSAPSAGAEDRANLELEYDLQKMRMAGRSLVLQA